MKCTSFVICCYVGCVCVCVNACTPRLEMSAELLRQKELENLHRQRLLTDPLGLHAGLPPEHPALRSLQDIPEGHPLREELSRRSAMLVLRHSNTPLLSLNHQGASQQAATPSKESSSASSSAASAAAARKSARKSSLGLRDDGYDGKESQSDGRGRDADTDGGDEEMRDSDSDGEVENERPGRGAGKSSDGHGLGNSDGCHLGKDGAKSGDGGMKDLGESSGRLSVPCSSAGADSPNHHLYTPGLGKAEAKYLPAGVMPPLPALPGQTLPFGFPYASPYFHSGESLCSASPSVQTH